MKLSKLAKRIAIFAYFDKDGIVDDYVPVLVGAVAEQCDFVLCMVNGTLNPEDETRLRAVSDEIVYRPNEGLDITAYQEGYFRLRDAGMLTDIDELLFFNQTIFGPVYPLAELFCSMASCDLDFWGLTKHKGLKAELTGTIWDKVEYGYIPPHIQSYFFAVRASLLHAPEFDKYWNTLPKIHNYIEAVSFHEMKFTKHFTDLGFTGAPYLDCTEWEAFMDYPLMGMPVEMLREKRTPFIKRKSFFSERSSYRSTPQGAAGGALLKFLAQETDYDIHLILQNITRTVPAADYTMALSMTSAPETVIASFGTVAAVLWLNSAAALPLAQKAVQQLPVGSGVFCIVGAALQEAEVRLVLPSAQLLRTEQTGLACLASELLEQVHHYEYLLYLPLLFSEISDDLGNATMVEMAVRALGDARRDIAMLESLPSVGVLCPWQDTLGEHFLSKVPCVEFEGLNDLLEGTVLEHLTIGNTMLRLPQSAFFCRADFMDGFGALPWDNEQFVALGDYVLPLFAQSKALLCGFSIPWQDAVRELWNMREQLDKLAAIMATPRKRRFDLIAFRTQAILDFYNERRYSMTLEQAFVAPLSAKQKLWIILQILLKREHFLALHRLLHGGREPAPPSYPEDPLD